MRKQTLLGVGLVLGLTLLSGCGPEGDPDVVPVTGTVTMDGQPLPNATVVFVSGQSRPSGGITDESGRYELNYTGDQKGARVGPNVVRITTAKGPSETMEGDPVPPVPEKVPPRYNAQTELSYTVEAGKKNVADFVLESK